MNQRNSKGAKASRPRQEHRGEARAGALVGKGQRYGESLRGMRSRVRVGCFPHKSTDRQMDRQKGQREMAKGHMEEVKGGGEDKCRSVCVPQADPRPPGSPCSQEGRCHLAGAWLSLRRLGPLLPLMTVAQSLWVPLG